MTMSGNEAWNRNVFLNADGRLTETGQISLSGRLFQMVGPATGKALPPTVDSFTLLAYLLTFLTVLVCRLIQHTSVTLGHMLLALLLVLG